MSAEQSVTEAPVSQGSQASDGQQFGGSGGYEPDDDGQQTSPGMGQSKSSRRRRRKRKGKADGAPGQTAEGGDAASASGPQVIPSLHAGEAAATPSTSNGNQGQGFRQNHANGSQQGRSSAAGQQQNSGGQAINAPGGTKRWKKKFRERDRQRGGGDNPGNQAPSNGSSGGGFAQSGGQAGGQSNGAFRGPDTHQPGNGGGGFKRKGGFGGGGGKQQRSAPRGFVGPMDHSYRAVSSNVFEVPPSTTEPHGNGYGGGGRGRSYQGDSQPIDYSQGRAIPIAPGAPTRIYFFIEDLFFTAKIQETARKLGVKVAFIKNEKEQLAALMSGEDEDRPGLIVFDLNNANAKPMTLIPKLKAKLKKTTSIIGFLSHLQGDLKAKAVEAGCDTVMPRAAFSQNLPNLLRRYGIEEVEEPNYNQ